MENSNRISELEENSSNIPETDLNEDIVIEDKITKPLKKNEQAKELIAKSKEIIYKADVEVEAIKKSIANDVEKFEELKNSLLSTTIPQNKSLLEKASFVYIPPESDEEFELSIDNGDNDIKIKDISGGGFTAFIFAILSMIATAIGWMYLASTKVGVDIKPPVIPDNASIDKMLAWIGGGMTGGDGNTLYGMITIGVSALLIGLLVYNLFVSIKENINLKVAKNTFEKSNQYLEKQKETKTELERIDEHIKKIVPLLEDYQVLLNEENAKLKRIIHVEGELEDNSQYHQSSIAEMKETERLMEKIEEVMKKPITKEGKLNQNSVYALDEARNVYEYYLSKIYV